MNGVGKRIREMRIMLDIAQKDLGASVGLSSGAISGIESGDRNPPFEAFISICEIAFKATFNLDWLLFGYGEPLKTIDEVKNALTEEEDDLVKIYRDLDKEGRRILLGRATEQARDARLEGNKEEAGNS